MRSVHLHLGSVYSINSCVLRGIPEVEACVLKGEKSYGNWLSDKSHCKWKVLNDCVFDGQIDNKTVAEDDTYYFIHYATGSLM